MSRSHRLDGWFTGKTRQFYYINNKHAELLRIERIDGKFAMGNGNPFDVQDKPPDWSSWQQLLESSDRLQQLRGLAAFWSYDNLKHLGPVEAKTRVRLEHLSKSSKPSGVSVTSRSGRCGFLPTAARSLPCNIDLLQSGLAIFTPRSMRSFPPAKPRRS